MKVAILPNAYDIKNDEVIIRNGDFIRESAIYALTRLTGVSVIDASWTDQHSLSQDVELAIRFRFHEFADHLIVRLKGLVPATGEVLWLEEFRPTVLNWQDINTHFGQGVARLFAIGTGAF